MTSIRLIGFSGEIPKIQPRILPESASQYAFNCRLEDGALVPIKKPLLITSLASLSLPTIKTIYLYGDTWLEWQTVVNAVPGAVANDRLYYTGDGTPKMRVGSNVYNLKVSAPTVQLSGSVSGTGSGNTYTRLYVYTFVTDYGEESEPSPISASINWQSGQTVTLSGFQSAPAGRAITKQRIYRSQSSATGSTDLYFIAERSASNSNYVDIVPVDESAEVLPSLDYNQPIDTLSGLISLPNGMMAAFNGKDLYFCEPYRPHAWPVKYVLTVDYEIVALGAFGNYVAILTKGTPYVAHGTAPENMVMERIETNLPCINAQGAVDMGYAVAYPSNDGLVVLTQGSAQVVTSQIMTRNDWITINPSELVAAQFYGRYYASYKYTLNEVEITGTFVFDLANGTPSVFRVKDCGTALYYRSENSSLYILKGDEVYQHDAFSQAPDFLSWKSKLFIVPTPTNFGAIYIDAGQDLTQEEIDSIEAENEAINAQNEAYLALDSMGSELNGSAINVFGINGDPLVNGNSMLNDVTATVYANGNVVASVNDVNKAVRLPSGFLERKWEISLSGTSKIYEVIMAGTVRELRNV